MMTDTRRPDPRIHSGRPDGDLLLYRFCFLYELGSSSQENTSPLGPAIPAGRTVSNVLSGSGGQGSPFQSVLSVSSWVTNWVDEDVPLFDV